MRERDIRQAAYDDCKKGHRREIILIIVILSFASLIFWFGITPISFYLGCGMGLLFIAVMYVFVFSFRKRHKKELDVITQGILTEAEVVELKEELDSDDQMRTMAVYEVALPGGRKHRVKESVTSTMAGCLGIIRVGTRLPIFIDQNNPDQFRIIKPKVTEQTFQDMDSSIIEQYLSRHRKSLDKPRSNELFRAYKKSGCMLKAIAATFITVAFVSIGFFMYGNWRDTRHDPIDLPSGAYISSIGTTEVYQYFPETNEWSYYLEDIGVTRTKEWRFDSKCRKLLELQYDYSFAQGGFSDTNDTPALLIPESYRDRLDEFIKDGLDTSSTIP